MSSVQQQRRRNNDDDKYNNDDDNEMTNALWNYSTCRPDEHKHYNNRYGVRMMNTLSFRQGLVAE